MKFFIKCLVIFSFITNVVFAESSQTQSVSELSQLLNSYNSYQANFTQNTYEKNGKLAQSSNGIVTLQRPGKFRWETLAPFHQILIANDHTLWIYDVDLAEAAKKTITAKTIDPAILLSQKVKSVLKQFFVTKIRLKDQSIWYQLTTPIQNDAFQVMQLRFMNNQLTDIRMINKLGQTTLFHFSNIQLNLALNDDLFNFVPPSNVKILK